MQPATVFTTYSLYRISNVVAALLVTVLMSRLVGVAGFGVFTLMIANVGLLNFLSSLGISGSIAFFSASGEVRDRTLLKYIWLFFVFQVFVVFLVEWVHYVAIGKFWLLSSDKISWALVAAVYMLSLSLNEKYNVLLNGKQLFLQPLKLILTCNILLILVLFFAGLSANAATMFFFFCCYITAHVMQTLLLIITWHRRLVDDSISYVRVHKIELGRLIAYSKLAFISNIFQYAAYRVDIWTLNYFKGTSDDLGLYSLATKLGQVYWILPNVFANIILVGAALSVKATDIERFNRLLRLMNTAGLLAAVVLMLASFFLIPLVFGSQYQPSVALLWWQLPGLILFCNAIILAAFFAGKKQLNVNIMSSLICLFVNLSLCILLVPVAGATGAALAVSAGFSAASFFSLYKYSATYNVPLSHLLYLKKEDWVYVKHNVRTFFNKIAL